VAKFDLGLDVVTIDLVGLTTRAPMCSGKEGAVDYMVLDVGGLALPDIVGLVSIKEAVD
jgi:hypothetical protein